MSWSVCSVKALEASMVSLPLRESTVSGQNKGRCKKVFPQHPWRVPQNSARPPRLLRPCIHCISVSTPVNCEAQPTRISIIVTVTISSCCGMASGSERGKPLGPSPQESCCRQASSCVQSLLPQLFASPSKAIADNFSPKGPDEGELWGFSAHAGSGYRAKTRIL